MKYYEESIQTSLLFIQVDKYETSLPVNPNPILTPAG